jgi:glycosyltransferase involved in cell wall biosynthesis
MRKIFYFGLEPLEARYTYQLCKEWMPDTFKKYDNFEFVDIEGNFNPDKKIKVGVVLDAVGRGVFSLSQCSNFLQKIENGEVKDNDVLFLQDFWTPGLDSIFYALDLYGIKLKVYAMIHAQSVDEYDFTHSMKDWMRFYELGLDNKLTAAFVGSTVHKEQLRQAGFKTPIHVVSLPIHIGKTLEYGPNEVTEKKNIVLYTSRLDKEKNPFFMLKIARTFLNSFPDYEWHLTTSGSLKSNLEGVIEDIRLMEGKYPRFKVFEKITKQEYYQKLAESKIQFNSSLQDYVSWTALEASLFHCDLVYPNFRSFPEFIPEERMYMPFSEKSALQVLNNATQVSLRHTDIVLNSDIGRLLEGFIVCNDYEGPELNIWHEKDYILNLLGL